jgi:GT2 family glycosyltransferase
MTTVAIVVPTLGTREAWLRDCLHSIVSQDGPDCRVIVVAPTAANLRVCEEFDVRVARFDEPGLSRAVNYGWSLQPSRYVAWLGDDDLLAPGSLAATVDFLDRRRDCSMVYGRVRYIDADSNTLWVTRPSRFASGYLRAGKNFVGQQGSLINRRAADDVGWLDPTLMNSMDQDFFTRLRKAGRRAYIPVELGAYRWHATSITWAKGSLDESEMVRQRHLSVMGVALYRAWRIVGRRLDWAISAILRRVPPPAVPLRDGSPYIAPVRRAS